MAEMIGMKSAGALAGGKVELARNCLRVDPAVTDAELRGVFDALSNVQASTLFWMGDFLLFAESRKGEAYAKALANTNYSPGVLYNAKWVCKAFKPEARASLSFSHHYEALGECKGDAAKALGFLTDAEQGGMSVKEMRVHIRKSLAPPDAPVGQQVFEDTEFLTLVDAFNTLHRWVGKWAARDPFQRDYVRAELKALDGKTA